jgi:hypothetical protein
VAEDDDTAKPLSPLEIKLAAIAATSGARGNVSMHAPQPAAAEPGVLAEAAAAEPALSAEREAAAEPERGEENTVAESPQETPPLHTEFASTPPKTESPLVQPATDETIYVDPSGAAQVAKTPEATAELVPEAGVGTAPLPGEAPGAETASPAAYATSEDTSDIVPASALRAPAVLDPNVPAEEPRSRLPVVVPGTNTVRGIDAEYVATAGLLGAVLVIGLATVSNYAITPEEFRYDELGQRLLSLYGGNRDAVSATDGNTYAQWFQVLTAAVQSFIPAHRFDVRHALTFLIGLAGLAALLPLGRLAIGRWAGLSAIVLCLLTGNFYGHLFFSPSDVPLMAAMTWATMAVVLMASPIRLHWGAVIAVALFTGLAIATRPAGLFSHVLLLLAIVLCACEAVFRLGPGAARPLLRITLQTVIAIALAWVVAIALMPTLHGPDLLQRLRATFTAPSADQVPASIISWGREWPTNALPWHYLPGELLARLSGVFIVLLGLALLFALGSFILLLLRRRHAGGELANVSRPVLMFFLLVRARAALIVTLAALLPILIIMIARPPLYDGIRLVLFIVPPLALLAAWGLLRLSPLIRAFPIVAAALIGIQIGGGVLVLASQHPLEYITTNAFAGGTRGSYARFELDYWGAAATEALRKLEQRLDYDRNGRFASEPPHILMCPYASEHLDAAMFKRNWAIAEGRLLADFIIETRKSRCGEGVGTLIDEIKRRDQPFAWTLELPAQASPRDEISD